MKSREGFKDLAKVLLIGAGAILWVALSTFICFECFFMDQDYGVNPPLLNILLLLDMIAAAVIVFLLLRSAFRLIDKI